MTLVVGLMVGYAVGGGQRRGIVAVPGKPASSAGLAPVGVASGTISGAPPASIDNFGSALTQNPGTCSVQVGHDLELGIPVTNQSTKTVLLESVKPVPLVPGILKVVSWRWDPCGFDNDGIAPDKVALRPGATTWVTAVVESLIACPGPAPLQFQVSYVVNSQKSTFNLPGFSDLSAVHYSGCPTPAA